MNDLSAFPKSPLVCFLCILLASSASSQQLPVVTPDAEFPGSRTQRDLFGQSVAAQSDRFVVGAPSDDTLGSRAGSAYVYTRSPSGWQSEAQLFASPGAPEERFGTSVATEADTVFVGAPSPGSTGGAVFVFQNVGGGWIPTDRLVPSTGGSVDFGSALAVSNGTLVVGDTAANLAFVFRRVGGSWAQTDVLDAGDSQPSDAYGFSLAVSGGRILVGAIRHSNGSSGGGAVYVWKSEATGFQLESKLVASSAATAFFGNAIAFDGRTALIGAPGGSTENAVFHFERTGSAWQEVGRILEPLPRVPSNLVPFFGSSVSMAGPLAFVGAPQRGVNGPNSGAVYMLSRNGNSWEYEAELLLSRRTNGTSLGFSSALAGADLIVGARCNGAPCSSALVFGRIAPATPIPTLSSLPLALLALALLVVGAHRLRAL